MKTGSKVKFSLKEYTSKLIASFQPIASKQKTLLVNEIQEDLYVGADENILSTIISGLLSNVLGQKNRRLCQPEQFNLVRYFNYFLLSTGLNITAVFF